MTEKLSFVFTGKIASENAMDFYESARFQYSASRLLVKLDNFRKSGTFPKKITFKNTPDIRILANRKRSFGLDVVAPAFAILGPLLIEVPLSALFSYIIERIFKSADDDAMREALATNRELVGAFDRAIAGRDDSVTRTLELLREQIDHDRQLNSEIKGLYERLLADENRRGELAQYREQFRRIDKDAEAELITMSAPLVKEMNVPLRRSASSVTVSTSKAGKVHDILRADKKMADAVNLAVVDRHQTTIDINIVQFNKQNGWGKFENDDWDGLPSFQVPGDLLDDMKQTILLAMNDEIVEIDCYFMRSAAGVPLRIILTDVRPVEEI